MVSSHETRIPDIIRRVVEAVGYTSDSAELGVFCQKRSLNITCKFADIPDGKLFSEVMENDLKELKSDGIRHLVAPIRSGQNLLGYNVMFIVPEYENMDNIVADAVRELGECSGEINTINLIDRDIFIRDNATVIPRKPEQQMTI